MTEMWERVICRIVEGCGGMVPREQILRVLGEDEESRGLIEEKLREMVARGLVAIREDEVWIAHAHVRLDWGGGDV